MRVLFIISGADTAFWLSEVTHPYWHLTERDVEVDFASPDGGKVKYDPYSDPYSTIPPRPTTWSARDFFRTRYLLRSWGTP
jgi:putative intracellular protease/amidase